MIDVIGVNDITQRDSIHRERGQDKGQGQNTRENTQN